MTQSRIERKLNEARITNHGKLAVLTVVVAVGAGIISVATMTSGELTAADRVGLSDAGSAAPQPQADTSFSFFPAQYVNQATEPSEHIQAF